MTDQTDSRETKNRDRIGASAAPGARTLSGIRIPRTLGISGVTDAFLTRLDDIDGSVGSNGVPNGQNAMKGNNENPSCWYLYGRMADQKTQNGTGIFLWTSADLKHWETPTPVLGIRDIPWASLSHGGNHPYNENSASVPAYPLSTHSVSMHSAPARNMAAQHTRAYPTHAHPTHAAGYSVTDRHAPARHTPAHPAVLRFDGRIYLYFELDGQIGAAWAPSPAGPFTVRRTPLLRIRQWGRTTDPGVLAMAAEVDEFGGITPVTDRPVRTDWLLWRGADPGNGSGHNASGTVTLCTLGQDRMELALGVHRSREIRVTPPKTGVDETGQAAATTIPPLTAIARVRSATVHAEEKSPSRRQPAAGTGTQATQRKQQNPSRTASRIISPQIVRLGERFCLLWINESGQVLSAQASHLTGPWKEASAVVFAGGTDDNGVSSVGDRHASRTPAPDTLSGSLPGSLSSTPVRLSVTTDAPKPKESATVQTVPNQGGPDLDRSDQNGSNQAILTVSDQTSTHFFVLKTLGTRLTTHIITAG